MYKWIIIVIGILAIAFPQFFLKSSREKPFLKIAVADDSKAAKTAFAEYITYLFCKQDLGYALIGAKPMSISIEMLPNQLALNTPCFPYTLCNSKDFLFRVWKESPTTMTIALIHRKMFCKTYETHKSLFHKILGTLSAEDFLHQIATSEKSFFTIIKDNETLLGILLGFGKKNSLLFARYSELFPNRPFLLPPNIYFYLHAKNRPITIPKLLLPYHPFETVGDERAWLKKHFNKGSFNPVMYPADFTLVFPVGFRVIDCKETKMLIDRYTKAHKLLTALFTDRNCFDVIEEQLCASNPLLFDEVCNKRRSTFRQPKQSQ